MKEIGVFLLGYPFIRPVIPQMLRMAENEKQHTVIIRSSMQSSPLSQELSEYFKVRVSNNCVPDYIFPSFSRSFMILDPSVLSEDDLNRVIAMGRSFKTSFVIVIMSNTNKKALNRLQNTIASQPKLLPVRRDGVLHAMMNILQLVQKADSANDPEDIETPAEKDKAIVSGLMLVAGLKRHDCLVLQQGMGSLARISSATVDEIMRYTSLSTEKAKSVVDFFLNDKVK